MGTIKPNVEGMSDEHAVARVEKPLSDPGLRELATQVREVLGPHLRARRFRRGDLLWREGETSGMLVAIRSGWVKIYRLLPTGRTVTLYLFGPDDVFGFLPFLDGQAYPAYAQAVEVVEADVMPRSELLRALREEPELAQTLIALLGRRLRAALDRIHASTGTGSRTRVAAALHAHLPVGAAPAHPIVVELPVPAHEFAAAIGVAPETFSRAISSLSEAGVLDRMDGGRLRVLDPLALQRAADPLVEE